MLKGVFFELLTISTKLKWDLSCWHMLECFDVFSGSQERQDKLREMGFVDILHKLTQASDPNLSDRWARIAILKHKTLSSDR